MDVFSTELGIRLSFVKTSEFRGRGCFNPPPPRYATDYMLSLYRGGVLSNERPPPRYHLANETNRSNAKVVRYVRWRASLCFIVVECVCVCMKWLMLLLFITLSVKA
jgi:hypothetical protein